MSSLSPKRYERVRKSLLHVSLRQVTEDPDPRQPMGRARRAARFTKNRQDLDIFNVRQAAQRAAAEHQKDDVLRAKLDRTARKDMAGPPQPSSAAQNIDSTNPSSSSSLVDRTKAKHTHVATPPVQANISPAQPSTSPKTPLADHEATEQRALNFNTPQVDRTLGASANNSQSHAAKRRKAKPRDLVPDSDNEDLSDEEDSAFRVQRSISAGRSARQHLLRVDSSENIDPISTPATPTQCISRSGCTRKHFRIKRIIGKQSINGDVYYDVRWKPSWVPSHLIITCADGRDHFIKIDGKDWYIKEMVKSKIKKGILKRLVRWTDDTQEPLRQLGKALTAVAEFEVRPKLKRRVLTFEESSLDHHTLLPQSEDHSREAQLHLAKKWPVIEPRNDIDLLPALRQIISEDPEHPRNDKLMFRKTHFRLLDQQQIRPLKWNEAYILSGRHYECTLPRRNALLLQVIGDTESNSCCERCMSDTSPFAECVMDTSDEDPWFNGGCANCGAFEANSTCLHHLVGRVHLEPRGRTSGVTRESTREARAALGQGNLSLGDALHRLKFLNYDNDSDSETYSADSYNTSDESDDSASEIDTNDDNNDESNAHSFTPNSNLTDSATGTSDSRSTRVNSSSANSGKVQADEGQDSSPTRLNRPGRLRRINKSRLRAPSSRSEATVSSKRLEHISHQRSRNSQDHDSSTPASEVQVQDAASGDATSQDFGGEDFWDDLGPIVDNFDPFSDDGPAEAEEAEDTAAGRSTARTSPSPESERSTSDSLPVVQSVETSHQRSAPVQIDPEPAHTHELNMPSARAMGKKRASSQPPMHERPSRRSVTDPSRPSAITSSRTSIACNDAQSVQASIGPLFGRIKEEKVDRGVPHTECTVGRPCKHPNNFDLPSYVPLITVYKNNIDGSRRMILGEAEYVISQCSCHWATAFTTASDDRFGLEVANPDNRLSKAAFLLKYYPDRLLEAARECCPLKWDAVEVIVID